MSVPGPWRVAVASGVELGERPVWDAATGTVLWSDVTNGRIHRTEVADQPPWRDQSVRIGDGLGTVSLRQDGGWVVTSAEGFTFHDAQGRVDADPVPVTVPAGARFNDGACDPAGRLLAGTTTGDAERPNGLLWSLGPTGEPVVLLEGLTESNGLGWSLDGTVFYYIDSGEPVVRRYGYDVASGALTGRLPDLAVTGDLPVAPDGLVVAADGTVWIALWQGGEVRCYSTDGQLLTTIPVPVTGTTCPAFVGPGLDLLVVATGWEGLTEEERAAQPWSGHLLVTDAPVRGQLPYRFAGRRP